ncbi:MAG TPA: hypothetical protein VK177_15560 [Flavobacteriales bacterium]|nr:hypothetical protein [Flavobacteriales bacterium]
MDDAKTYFAKDVFTPSTQAKLTFVERDKNSLNDELVDAINTPGKQIVLYGHSGTGKSTLLFNVINRIYSDSVVTRCTSDMNYEKLVLNAFDSLNIYFQSSSSSKTVNDKTLSLSGEYLSLKGSIGVKSQSENSVSSQRIIPPQLTAQRLAEFMGAVDCCWIIEDFHKIKPEEKVKLSQQLKVFVDSSEQYPLVKTILIGAVNTAREVIEYDLEMDRRVSELLVPLMESEELHKILEIGENLMNVRFSQKQKNDIVKFSSGLASITHQIALNMCVGNGIDKTSAECFRFTDDHFNSAIKKYITHSSDTLRKRYDLATKVGKVRKYDNGKIIIEALAEFDLDEVQQNDLLLQIRKTILNYPASNLSAYLVQLQSDEKGGIIRINPENGKYSFSDPFMGAYVKCLKEIELDKIKDPNMKQRKIKEAFEVLLSAFIKKFDK